MDSGHGVIEVPGFGTPNPEHIEQAVFTAGQAATAVTTWAMDHPYLANTIGVGAAVILLGGIASLVRTWYIRRTLRRRIEEKMPKGVQGSEDDYTTAVISDAVYEAIFALACENKISWKKADAAIAKLAGVFDSRSLKKGKTHPKAVARRILANIDSVKAGPKHPIPAPPEEPALKFLRK